MSRRYENYDFNQYRNLYDGPDPFMILDELTEYMTIKPNMKILDLGCGNALSSLFLAKEFGCTVYATDWQSSSGGNYEFVKELGFENKIYPFFAEADKLPFLPETFDAVVCINKWHAFGDREFFFTDHIRPFLKPDAQIGIAAPGITVAAEMQKGIADKDVHGAFWSKTRCQNFFEKEFPVSICREMDCAKEAMIRWFKAASPLSDSAPDTKYNLSAESVIIMTVGVL